LINRDNPAFLHGEFQQLITYRLSALLGIGNDIIIKQYTFVIGRLFNHHFTAEEPVAICPPAGTYRSNLHRYDLITIQSNEPSDRTDEMQIIISPPHALWKRQTRNQCLQIGKEINRRLAFDK